MRKVLLPIPQGQASDTGVLTNVRTARGYLENWGYQVDVRVLSESSDWAASFATQDNGYEFIVLCRQKWFSSVSNYATLANGSAVIPTLWVAANEDGSFIQQTAGGDRESGALVPVVTDGALEYAIGSSVYSVYTGFETKVTPIATDNATGYMTQWKMVGTASIVYVDAARDDYCLLPRLLQEAISDGLLNAPPRPLIICQDIDDMPSETGNTLADCDALYDVQNLYGFPMVWGIHAQSIGSYSQAVLDFLKARTAYHGGLIYLIDHNGTDDWTADKATIDASFRSDLADMVAEDLAGSDLAGSLDNQRYRYFNNNDIADTGAQLMSPYLGQVSSPGDDSEIVGYGHSGFRASTTKQLDIGAPFQCLGIAHHRGMRVLAGYSAMATTDKLLTLADDPGEFASHCITGNIVGCGAYRHIPYLHGGNFWDGHDGGNAPGLLAMTIVGHMVQRLLPDVARFGHGFELAARDGFSGNQNQQGAI